MKTLTNKLATIKQAVNECLVSREKEVDLVLSALVAREHCLLVGDYGAAKTLLINLVVDSIEGASKFSVLLNKFSTPDEVFGPVDVSKLKEGKYSRNTNRKLPSAHVAYIDEIFKASTAILNTLLGVLNEREYEDDSGKFKCPLITCVASSNEWPSLSSSKELGPLFDRFLFRKAVKSLVSKSDIHKIVWNRDRTLKLSPSDKLTLDELVQLNNRAEQMSKEWSSDLIDTFETIATTLYSNGVMVSNRRLFQAVKAVNAFALVNGHDCVTNSDLLVLSDVLWNDYESDYKRVVKTVKEIVSPWAAKLDDLVESALLLDQETASKMSSQGNLEASVLVETLNKLKLINDSISKVEVPAEGAEAKKHAREVVAETIKKYYKMVVGV